MIKLIVILVASLCAALYGLYAQVQSSGELKSEIKQHRVSVEAHKAAFKFTDGVMSSHTEIANNAQVQIDLHDDNVADADDSAKRLRDQLEIYIRKSANDRAGFAEYRKAAEAKYRMLADMQSESDRLAGIYADQADKNRIAGLACEQSYGELVLWIRKTYGIKE